MIYCVIQVSAYLQAKTFPTALQNWKKCKWHDFYGNCCFLHRRQNVVLYHQFDLKMLKS